MGQAQSRGLNLRGSPAQVWLQRSANPPHNAGAGSHLFRCCRVTHSSDRQTNIRVRQSARWTLIMEIVTGPADRANKHIP